MPVLRQKHHLATMLISFFLDFLKSTLDTKSLHLEANILLTLNVSI